MFRWALLPALLLAARPAAAELRFAGLSYSPTGVAREADLAKQVPEATIRDDLAQLAKASTRVRTYSVDRGIDKAVPLAAALGLKVSVGIWLGPDRAKNDAEIARGIAAVRANPKAIDRVFVGNEAIVRGELSASDVAGYIRAVRTALGAAIPIGTAEPWSTWLKSPTLATASDFIGAHIFPYWDGVPEKDAIAYLDRRVGELREAFPGKAVIVAETGWPSAGSAYKGAVPSLNAEEHFLKDFAAHAAAAGYDYYIHEGFDEPWKTAREGDVGASWGIFDAARRPKFDLAH